MPRYAGASVRPPLASPISARLGAKSGTNPGEILSPGADGNAGPQLLSTTNPRRPQVTRATNPSTCASDYNHGFSRARGGSAQPRPRPRPARPSARARTGRCNPTTSRTCPTSAPLRVRLVRRMARLLTSLRPAESRRREDLAAYVNSSSTGRPRVILRANETQLRAKQNAGGCF